MWTRVLGWSLSCPPRCGGNRGDGYDLRLGVVHCSCMVAGGSGGLSTPGDSYQEPIRSGTGRPTVVGAIQPHTISNLVSDNPTRNAISEERSIALRHCPKYRGPIPHPHSDTPISPDTPARTGVGYISPDVRDGSVDSSVPPKQSPIPRRSSHTRPGPWRCVTRLVRHNHSRKCPTAIGDPGLWRRFWQQIDPCSQPLLFFNDFSTDCSAVFYCATRRCCVPDAAVRLPSCGHGPGPVHRSLHRGECGTAVSCCAILGRQDVAPVCSGHNGYVVSCPFLRCTVRTGLVGVAELGIQGVCWLR